jgi:putative membrane protein
MKDSISIFLKGILMGICDLIPGISGGTIAFITGIYQRLINAVKSFSIKLIPETYNYIKKGDKTILKSIKKLDLIFLTTLILGIITAIVIGSHLIKYLLNNYFVYTITFFIGLILASSINIFKEIKNHKISNIIFGIIGLIIGILLGIIIPVTLNPSLTYIFISGFIAISAMFLPGISGSFILLILGVYEFMINVLHNIIDKIYYFFAFIFGGILGALTISKFVSYLFEKDKPKTLYFLLGLVLGCLSIPLRNIILYDIIWTIKEIITTSSFLIIGFFIVIMIIKTNK